MSTSWARLIRWDLGWLFCHSCWRGGCCGMVGALKAGRVVHTHTHIYIYTHTFIIHILQVVLCHHPFFSHGWGCSAHLHTHTHNTRRCLFVDIYILLVKRTDRYYNSACDLLSLLGSRRFCHFFKLAVNTHQSGNYCGIDCLTDFWAARVSWPGEWHHDTTCLWFRALQNYVGLWHSGGAITISSFVASLFDGFYIIYP